MVRRLLLLLLLVAVPCWPQAQPPSAYPVQLLTFGGVPTGPCDVYQVALNTINGNYYSCSISTRAWILGGGGGGSPGGSTFSTQINNLGFFGVAAPVTPPGVFQFYGSQPNGAGSTSPLYTFSGVPVDASNPATLLVTHRGNEIPFSGTTNAFSLPATGGAGFGFNFAFLSPNFGSGNLTTTATSPNTIDGGGAGGSNTTLPGWNRTWYSDNSGNWHTVYYPMFTSFGSTCANALTWSTTSGFGCSGPLGGTTFQANGTNLSSSSTVNFQNSAATNGLTLTESNPSAGNVQLGFTGTLNDAGLTSGYSGTGTSGAGTIVTGITLNRNAAPTATPLANTVVITATSGALAAITWATNTWYLINSGDAETVQSTINQPYVTLQCPPGITITQSTASTTTINVTADHVTIIGCNFKPIASGTASPTITVGNVNYFHLRDSVFDSTGSTATNGGNGWINITGGAHAWIEDPVFISSPDNGIILTASTSLISDFSLTGMHFNGTLNTSYGFRAVSNTFNVTGLLLSGNTCFTNGSCLSISNLVNNSVIVGNKHFLTGSTGLQGFAFFAGPYTTVIGNVCDDQGFAMSSSCFETGDGHGFVIADNAVHMTGNNGQPYTLHDNSEVNFHDNVANPTINSANAMSSAHAWGAANPCINAATQAAAATNSNINIHHNTCFLPPSFTGIAIQVACGAPSGTGHCDLNRVDNNIIIGQGTAGGTAIEAIQTTGPMVGFEASGNQINDVVNGIVTSGTITGNVSFFNNEMNTTTTKYTFAATAPALVTDYYGMTFASIPSNLNNGSILFLTDGTIANPCASGGTGSILKKLNAINVCN